MSKTLIIRVELTVPDEAATLDGGAYEIADWLFERLMQIEDVPDSIESFDGTTPLMSWDR